MEYKGKLYGHLGGKMYFDTGKTADDWDALEKRVSELEAENQALRQPLVSGSLVSPDAIQKEAERFQKATANKMAIERTAFAQGALWVRSLFLPNDR